MRLQGNGPWSEKGKNGPKLAPKNGNWGHFSFFSPCSGHVCFPPFGPWANFYFLAHFSYFPISDFRPVFHSIPGRLTRNHKSTCFRNRIRPFPRTVFRPGLSSAPLFDTPTSSVHASPTGQTHTHIHTHTHSRLICRWRESEREKQKCEK